MKAVQARKMLMDVWEEADRRGQVLVADDLLKLDSDLFIVTEEGIWWADPETGPDELLANLGEL